MKIFGEFKEFLQEYKVVGVAVAFIMATATTALVKSLVDNIMMPLISPLLPGGDWQAAILVAGPFRIGWGPFLSALVNFVMLALVVFIIARAVLKEEKVTKK